MAGSLLDILSPFEFLRTENDGKRDSLNYSRESELAVTTTRMVTITYMETVADRPIATRAGAIT